MTILNNTFGRAVAKITSGYGVISTGPGVATYVSLTARRSLNAWGRYQHQIRFASESEYAKAAVDYSTNRRITFQSGLDEGGKINWSAPQTQVVINFKAGAENLGPGNIGFLMEVESADLLFAAALGWHVKAWSGQPTDIVSGLATGLGLTSSLETMPKQQISLLQCYQTDFDFLRRVTRDYVTGQLAADVGFCVHGDALMTGSAGWSGWPRSKLFYPGRGGSNLDLQDTGDGSFEEPSIGAKSVTGVAYNPLSGQTSVFTVDPADVTRLAAQATPGDPAASYYHGRHQIQTSNYQEIWWARRYAETRLQQNGAAVTITGPDAILPGTLLYLQTPGKADTYAGIYQVVFAHTEIVGASAKTRVTLRRGQYNASQITAPGTAPQNAITSQSIGTGTSTKIQTGAQ